MSKGFCYLASSPCGLHKIGKSINPKKRLMALAALSVGLQLVVTIASEDMEWLEYYLHSAFSHCRIRSEWFRLTDAEVAVIKTMSSADSDAEVPKAIVALFGLNRSRDFERPMYDYTAVVPVKLLADKKPTLLGTLFVGNVRRILADKGLLQSQLAKMIGANPTVISRLMTAKLSPSGDTLDRVADALGVEPHELLLPVKKGKVKK